MSRTHKTTDIKYRKDKTWGMPESGCPEWQPYDWYREHLNSAFHSWPRLRKEQDFKDHWMSTPGSWTRMMMNRPMRKKLKQKLHVFDLMWVDEAEDLMEDFDEEEGYSHKPHIYYW
jgi:hypothetical protein